jgi:phage repressor protein C with HTH and peptisase S24 domain
VVLVYPSYRPRNGGRVVARLKDDFGGDVMFKLYNSNDGGKTITLTSYNPAHEPLIFTIDQFAWIAPVASATTEFEL